ncbi:MAG: DUF262 domain-containing protein [Myxococcota bacterium]
MDFKPLPERPEVKVLAVEEIVQYARAGRIRIPRLQRGFRWSRSNIVDLFDSIVRGYPLGSILVNQAPAPAERLLLGSTTLPVPAVADAWWLVDGQQRVTSLVAALTHPEPEAGGDFSVWVNLRTSEFQIGRPRGADWLPMCTLGDRTRLLHWSRGLQVGDGSEALVDRAFELHEIVTRFQLTAFVVRGADASTVRAIFGRVNRSGVPLEEHEVVDALFSEEARGKPLQQLATDLETSSRFGRLDEAWLLRCVKAVGDVSPAVRFDERHQLSDELVDRTRAALVRTLTLLREDAGFVHASVLPYRLPLIVLATFFDRFPHPSDATRERLVRWLWRGAVTQVHARSSIADVVAHTSLIGEDEEQTAQRLLARLPVIDVTLDAKSRWNVKGSFTRLYAAAMLARDAWVVSADGDFGVFLHTDAGRRRTLSEVFQDPSGGATIAGRLFWPRPLSELTDAEPEVLASVGVDERTRDAIERRDWHTYLERHGAWVEQALVDCLERYGGIGAHDRPTIAAILRRADAG